VVDGAGAGLQVNVPIDEGVVFGPGLNDLAEGGVGLRQGARGWAHCRAGDGRGGSG
jgi:hypothetical protein